MDPRLSLLLELQSVYTSQKEIEDDYQVIPQRRAEIEQLLDRIRSERDEAEALQQEYLKEQATREMDLQTNQDSRVKKEAQLMTIKNDREYQAMVAEIESIDRKNARNESRLLELMEGIEKANKTFEEKSKELEQKEEQFRDELAQLKAREDQLRDRLEQAKSVTQQVVDRFRPDLYQRFLRVYNTRGGMAVAPANNGHCGGCSIRLTPRIMQMVQRGQDLVQCECCNRFLYWEQDEEIEDLSAL